MPDDIKTTTTKQETASIPYNDLHLQFQLTEPAWGKEGTSDLYAGLQTQINKVKRDETGKFYLSEKVKRNLWGYLAYFTRDLRLGNLSPFNGEIDYCRYYLELAGDCLRSNCIKAFVTCLSKVITTIEISQSKGGFLRRRGGTITREDINVQDTKKPFKGIMGGQREDK